MHESALIVLSVHVYSTISPVLYCIYFEKRRNFEVFGEGWEKKAIGTHHVVVMTSLPVKALALACAGMTLAAEAEPLPAVQAAHIGAPHEYPLPRSAMPDGFGAKVAFQTVTRKDEKGNKVVSERLVRCGIETDADGKDSSRVTLPSTRARTSRGSTTWAPATTR